MYLRVGAPPLPDVLSPVLGDERISPRVLSALGLPSGMRLSGLDAGVWVRLERDAAEALAGEVVRSVTRRWAAVERLETPVSFAGKTARELELSPRARNGLLRLDYRHRRADVMPSGDPTVG